MPPLTSSFPHQRTAGTQIWTHYQQLQKQLLNLHLFEGIKGNYLQSKYYFSLENHSCPRTGGRGNRANFGNPSALFFPTFPALTAVTSQTSPYPPANPPSRRARRAAGAADAAEPDWHLGMDGWMDREQGSCRMQMVSFAGAKGGGESGLVLKSTQRCQDPAREEPRRDWIVLHHPHIP